MIPFNKIINLNLSSSLDLTQSITIYAQLINHTPEYNKIQVFDIPMGGRVVKHVGTIEEIYNLQIEIDLQDKTKFEKICKSMPVYFTSPMTFDKNYDNATINEPMFITNIEPTELFNEKRIGYIAYRIELMKSNITTTDLKKTEVNLNSLRKANNLTSQESQSKLKQFFKATSNTINKAKTTISKITGKMNKITSTVNTFTSGLQTFYNEIEAFSKNLDAIINLPEQLALQLDSIASNFSNIFSKIDDQFNAIKDFFQDFDFETHDPSQGQSSTNNYIATNYINQLIASSLFSYACESISNIDFTSIDDIELYKKNLQAIYKTINFINDINLLYLLGRQLTYTEIILNEKKNALKGYTIFNVENISSLEFCFLIYKDISKIQDIIKWNTEQKDLRILNGEIKCII